VHGGARTVATHSGQRVFVNQIMVRMATRVRDGLAAQKAFETGVKRAVLQQALALSWPHAEAAEEQVPCPIDTADVETLNAT
jgi:hypothetical protein